MNVYVKEYIRKRIKLLMEDSGRIKVSGYKKIPFSKTFDNNEAYENWNEMNKKYQESNSRNAVFGIEIERD